jgi:hypothetical protein
VLSRIAGNTLNKKTRAYLERGDSPRTGEPVWRNSYTVGQVEDRIWRPINDGTTRGGRRWTRALHKAARAFEIETRIKRREVDPGARNGALGVIGLSVLEYLYDVVDYRTGCLEPAVRTIADSIGHAYSAVHEALCRLRQHGFLRWMRRSKPVDNPEPGGPRVQQASNAYALLVPEGMKGWLARLVGKPELPACEAERRKRKADELAAMLATMTAGEYYAAHPCTADAVLGDVLGRLAAAVDRRDENMSESGTNNETGGSYISLE